MINLPTVLFNCYINDLIEELDRKGSFAKADTDDILIGLEDSSRMG
jgi:hypothetical protein